MPILIEQTNEEIMRQSGLTAVNEALRDYTDQYIREAFEDIKVFHGEDSDYGNADVRNTIKAMKSRLDQWHAAAVRIYGNLSQEINDIYVKINDLLAHDKIAKFKHRNDRIEVSFPILYLKDPKSNKLYNFVFDEVYLNADYIKNRIDEIMENDTIYYESFNGLYAQIDEVYKKYHSYIDWTVPFIKTTKYTNAPLGKALKVCSNNIKAYYSILSAINSVVSDETLYLNLIQKTYDSCAIKYGKDKKAMKEIDKIFMYCLAFTNRSMEWNMANYDYALKCFRSYAETIEKIYEIIKS